MCDEALSFHVEIHVGNDWCEMIVRNCAWCEKWQVWALAYEVGGTQGNDQGYETSDDMITAL